MSTTWGPLLSADEARRRFFDAWQPTFVRETVSTPDALGRVLAEEVHSPEDLPPFRRSLMDGFACRAGDIAGAPVTLRLIGEVLMGELATQVIHPGEAVRVPTGGALPEGSDVVVPIEQAMAK